MNREDKDIFDFMNSLSEEDSMKLLEGLDMSEEDLSEAQRNKIKSGVNKKLNIFLRKKNSKFNRSIIAASVAALLIFTGFTPSGQKVVAEIIKKLYFVPGIGRVQESEGRELYVLKKPVKYSYNGGEIVVKTAIRDKDFLSLGIEGDKYIEVEDFTKIAIMDEREKSYSNPGYSLGRGSDTWSGSLGFSNVPEDMNSFNIILPDKSKVYIVLSKADSFDDYISMGPTDIKNNLGITLVPAKEEGKMKFNLVQHPSKYMQVEAYGQQIDLENYGKLDISLKDDMERQYDLELPKGYSPPLSEFYFTPKEGAKNYTVEIPEVSLTYKISKNILFPIPKEGELEVNKNFDINGFNLRIKKVVRTENAVKVYVDTNYDINKAENLSELRIEAINSERNMGYGWHVTKDSRTVEYFEFEAKPNDNTLNLKIAEFNTILKGPWKFQFSAD
jgi:hypothetical protein